MKLNLLILICLLNISKYMDCSSLKQLIVFVRHGPTYPKKYSKDDNKDIDDLKAGQLSGNGLRMSYTLGQRFKSSYNTFLDFNSMKEFYALSNSDLSSQMTSQAFMMGMFGSHYDKSTFNISEELANPPFANQAFPDDKDIDTALPNGYYPFPSHSVSADLDYIFSASDPRICSNFEKISSYSKNEMDKYMTVALEVMNSNKNFEAITKTVLNKKINEVEYFELNKIISYLQNSRNLNKNLNISQNELNNLQKCRAVIDSIRMFRGNKLQIQLYRLNNMLEESLYPEIPIKENKKALFYFINETNLWAILQKLNLSSTDCLINSFNNKTIHKCFGPPLPASLLHFEIYSDNPEENLRISIS